MALVHAAPVSFDAAKLVASRIYSVEKQEFYCGCAIRWQAGKGLPDLTACGYKVRKNGPRAQRIEWEHVVPAQQFGGALACWRQGGRKLCSAQDAVFRQMEGDLFNLKPAIGEVNGDRSSFHYANLPGLESPYGLCPAKIDFAARLFEPRAAIRGDIARIYFYMADRYGLELAKSQQQLFMAWDKQDPVTDAERALQQRIAQQMGHSNEFVTGKKTWQLTKSASKTPLAKLNGPSESQTQPIKPLVRGNKNSKLYHLSHCRGYQQIAISNQVAFGSEQDAIASGYRRAGNCSAPSSVVTGD